MGGWVGVGMCVCMCECVCVCVMCGIIMCEERGCHM